MLVSSLYLFQLILSSQLILNALLIILHRFATLATRMEQYIQGQSRDLVDQAYTKFVSQSFKTLSCFYDFFGFWWVSSICFPKMGRIKISELSSKSFFVYSIAKCLHYSIISLSSCILLFIQIFLKLTKQLTTLTTEMSLILYPNRQLLRALSFIDY